MMWTHVDAGVDHEIADTANPTHTQAKREPPCWDPSPTGVSGRTPSAVCQYQP